MVFDLSVLKQCVYIIWRESVLNRIYDLVRVGPNINKMKFVCILSIQKQGPPNDGFLLNTLKTLFRLSRDL